MAVKRIAGWHQDMAKRLRGLTPVRDEWGSVQTWQPTGPRPVDQYGQSAPQWRARVVWASEVLKFFDDALPETYCQFDRKHRGDAVNVDLYAYDPKERVAIVQARHAFRQKAKWFMNVRKSYFLCGHNEVTKEPFRHPISAGTVHAAVRKHDKDQAAIIRACQAWMWQVTPRQLAASARQGDVLITPIGKEPAGEILGTIAHLDNHVVEAAEVRRNGELYARDLTIRHAKGQHRDVLASGWNRVTMAREARAWNFAARLGD